MKRSFKVNLRHLVTILTFSSIKPDNPLLEAISWIKSDFMKPNAKLLLSDCPQNSIPMKLLPYLCKKSDEDQLQINPTRYEFLTYRRLYQQLKSGSIFLALLRESASWLYDRRKVPIPA